MNKKPLLFRQGDVMLRQITAIPNNAKKAKSSVVAEGEGHHEHKAIGDLEVLELDDQLFLSVNSEGKLVHVHTGTENLADHYPIDLPSGLYEVIHQRQYNPYEKAIERVRDQIRSDSPERRANGKVAELVDAMLRAKNGLRKEPVCKTSRVNSWEDRVVQ